MHHSSPVRSARVFARIGFGLTLALMGFAHYQDPQFASFVAQDMGFLMPVGLAWGYVLPALMILGGLLLAFGIYMPVAASCSSIALASIPVGLLLKSTLGEMPLVDASAMTATAFIWLITLLLVVKGSCSVSACCPCPTGASCACSPVKPSAPAPKTPAAPAQVPVAAKPKSASVTKKRAAPRKRVASKKRSSTSAS